LRVLAAHPGTDAETEVGLAGARFEALRGLTSSLKPPMSSLYAVDLGRLKRPAV
jgi:hypothetical protein